MITEIITTLLGVVGGSMGMVLFYNQQRRRENASAVSAEIENRVSGISACQIQVDFLNRQLETAFEQLGKLQQIINDNRNRIIELLDEVNHLKIVLKEEAEKREEAEYYSCTARDCTSRSVKSSL